MSESCAVDPMTEELGPDTTTEERDSFCESEWSRDYTEYVPTQHFRNKCRISRRRIGEDTAVRCIEDGEMVPNKGGGVKFAYSECGVTYYLVAEKSRDGEKARDYRAVTIWPWVSDRSEALLSGRWTAAELDDMESVNNQLMERGNASW